MDVDLSSSSRKGKRGLDSASDFAHKNAEELSGTSKLSKKTANAKANDVGSNFNKAADGNIGSLARPKYVKNDHPPYIVHIHPLEGYNNNNSVLHPLTISRIVTRIVFNEVVEIKKIGRGKVSVQLANFNAANRLVDNQSLRLHKLRAFIPAYKTVSTGIIRGVPEEIEIENAIPFFESPVKIVQVRRLNHRSRIEGQTQYIPSRSICVKFSAQSMPQHIFLFKVKHEVFPYVPSVKVCFSCFKVGHVSRVCRGKPRCIYCGKDKHPKDVQCELKETPPRCQL